jgi:RNA polymerase sigma-70 factor (ECF subfamily)
MAQYAAGDEAAFQKLFGRYQCRAYRFFLCCSRSEPRAWDLYQELFIRIHRFRESYDPAQPFAPWFFQIARRVFVDDQRRAFRRREVGGLDEDAAPLQESNAEARAIACEQVQRLLSGLSAEQTRVLLGCKLEGRSHAELAKDLGKSVDAVKQMAARALRSLRAAVEPVGSRRRCDLPRAEPPQP